MSHPRPFDSGSADQTLTPGSVGPVSRRAVLLSSAAAAVAGLAGAASRTTAAGLVLPGSAGAATGRGAGRMKVGVIGCGGRGTGAAVNMLEASPDVEIWAIGDLFKDRMESSLSEMQKFDAARVNVPPERRFTGFDCYKAVLASGVDVVILATAPGFRPVHFAAAIDAGKHVFMEKPVATDPAGIRRVIAAAKKAAEKKLSVVAGTQRRHEVAYNEAFKRIQGGELGKVVHCSVYWNQGGLWMHKREPEWSDMEWQIRNWLYFAWLSGDHIVEQHVHNLDVAHWFMDAVPSKVTALGGRQVRTSPEYGHIFDHFGCDFEYEDGRHVASYCRQIDGCSSRVEEVICCADGSATLRQFGGAEFKGKSNWKWAGEQINPYVQEHKDLLASITGTGGYLNHGERIAKSTLMAIMGRMSAYTGKTITWQQAMESTLDLMPEKCELGNLPVPEVAIPGRSPVM